MAKKCKNFALFYPLWCKAIGEWGGSAHYPDPTAQSAPSESAEPRPPRTCMAGRSRGLVEVRPVAVIAYHADGSARKLRRLSHPRLAAASTHLRPLEGSGPAALVTGCSAVGTSLSGRVSPTRRLSPSGSLRQTLPLSLISPPSIRTLGHDPNRTRCCRRLSHAVVATRCSLGPGVVYSTRSLVEGPLVSLRRCQRATGGLVRLLGASM